MISFVPNAVNASIEGIPRFVDARSGVAGRSGAASLP